jgi:hypothetical protein
LRQRANAAAQFQTHFLGRGFGWALPITRLSQSSDPVAGRSSCRPGACQNRSGAACIVPPARTAPAPPSASTLDRRRPSHERDSLFVT